MKHKLLRFSLLSILTMLWGMVYAQSTETFVFSELGYDNAAEVTSVEGTDVTLTFAKGTNSNSPKYYTTGDAVRLYGGNTLKVTSSTKLITQVVFTFSSGSNTMNEPTADQGSYEEEGTTGTWAGEVREFTITRGGTSGHARIQKLEITLADNGDTRTATTITVGNDQEGTVGSTMNLPAAVVNDASGAPIQGAAITWTSSDEGVAKIDGTTLQLLAAGTATITATYGGSETYMPSSASFKVTVRKPYSTIAAMLQDITGTKTDVAYSFENLLVRFVSGSYTYVTDGQDNMLLYGRELGLNAGDIIKGSVKGQLYTYNSLPELSVNAADIQVEVASSGNEVLPTVIELNALANNINNYITIKNAVFVEAGTGKNLFFKVGEEQFTVYNQFGLDVPALEANKAYDITGFGSIFGENLQLYPTEIKEAQAESQWHDFAVNLTDAGIFATDVTKFGVKVADDGSYTATTFDDAAANFTVSSARFNDAQHGWVNCTFTVPVEGPVLVKLGDCRFGDQKGTITDAEGNVTEIKANASKDCWSPNAPDQNVVATYYRGLNSTTLTIVYNGYCPFISVTAVDPNDLPAEVAKYTVTFNAENSGAIGVAPTAITEDEGTEITIPQNFTLYAEGKTLTGWAEGSGATYAPGQKITLQGDMVLTPVFSDNEWNIGEQQEPVTVKFDFQKKNGAPNVQWQNQDNLVWVAQATAGDKTIDVAAKFSTNPGKFNNSNWDDWCQINEGTTFTIPSAKGAVVSVEAYNALTDLTIDGQNDYTSGKTISYTVQNTAETVDVVFAKEGSYYRYIQVVLPKVEKSTAGMVFDNVAGTVSWQVGNEASGTATEEIADAVQSALWTAGSEMTITTSTYFESTMVNYKPNNSNAGDVEGVMIEYRLKMAPGLTFKPSSVSYDCVKVGTDGATYSWGYVVDDQASPTTKVDAATTLRNNGANSSTAQLNHTLDMSNAGEGNVFAMRFYISSTANNKNICIGNVKINGVVNGTIQDVVTYSFAAAANPEEAGSVNIYPSGDKFEAGTELTLTATENFGYDFVNWTNAAGQEVSTDAKFVYTVESDETLTANFKKVNTYELALTVDGTNNYMVTINPQPTMVDGKMMYEEGQAVQLNATQYEGLVTFTNWSDGETNSSKIISMTENVNVTAFYAEADIIAGWDFYKAGGSGRKADFASTENEAAALSLVNTETGETQGWLDKSTEAAAGYESFAGAAVNWRTGSQNGDVGNWHWQTKLNAEAFSDIKVQFQMLYNYNAYQTYNAEYSLNGNEWTKFGSITMTGAKAPASFSQTLPAEANNQAELYIRMIADKTSAIDGTASANDGNTLAMFFITGTPKLIDDGVAPTLVSTVPENGATGASATGKVVLTFDERVKLADGAVAYINNTSINSNTQNPATGKVSGKTITFEYKGLEYSSEYAFTLAANTVADLTDNYITEPINLTFTTMVRPTVEKKLYDFIVPDDGSFKEALIAAAARQDNTQRYRIFVKQGEYVIPANQEAMVTGNDNNLYADPKTYFSSPNVSIIGENPENTSITNEMPNSLSSNPDAGANGQANPLEGIRTSGVLYLQSGATDTYFQDIKLWSATADATGRNVVLVDGGNRTICKNVTLWAYQDTYVSDNARNLYYFEGGLLRGRTDFLCGSGDVFYNNVTLQMCQDGGYIAVPRDNVKYGYVFKDCTIKGENEKVDGNYYLGRPWTEGAEVYFIDTKMEALPRAIGWAEMSSGGCTRMAEWNSTTASGAQVDLSGRAKTLGKDTPNPNNPVLTAEEALEIGNLHNMFGDWDPTLATEQAPVPTNVKIANNQITWDNSNYALLWAVAKDGKIIGFTTENSFELTEDGTYTVRAANEMGGLSEASEAVKAENISTGVRELAPASDIVSTKYYNLNGVEVGRAHKGAVIKVETLANGQQRTVKTVK